MGVIHHAVYLTYFEAARVEYFRRRGSATRSGPSAAIILQSPSRMLRHKKPLRFDERIAIEVRLSELGRASMLFTYRLVRPEAPSEVVAEGDTLLACVGNDGAIRLMTQDLAVTLCVPSGFTISATASKRLPTRERLLRYEVPFDPTH